MCIHLLWPFRFPIRSARHTDCSLGLLKRPLPSSHLDPCRCSGTGSHATTVHSDPEPNLLARLQSGPVEYAPTPRGQHKSPPFPVSHFEFYLRIHYIRDAQIVVADSRCNNDRPTDVTVGDPRAMRLQHTPAMMQPVEMKHELRSYSWPKNLLISEHRTLMLSELSAQTLI